MEVKLNNSRMKRIIYKKGHAQKWNKGKRQLRKNIRNLTCMEMKWNETIPEGRYKVSEISCIEIK